MEIFIKIAQMLFILSVLVILHELGHYLTARWFKVRAEKFYLFMDAGFSLFKKKIGDTEWGIGWLPIGGYVKLAGMMDESMDKEQMKQPPKDDEFRSKPAWQRLIILLGGIIVNILLAITIYTVMFSTTGQKFPSAEKFQKNGLMFTDVGHDIGFQDGDRIVSVDGEVQPRFDRMIIDILLGDEVTIDRNGKEVNLTLTSEDKKKVLSTDGKGFINPAMKAIVEKVEENSTAYKAGLRDGDQIVKINNQEVPYFTNLVSALQKNKGKTVNVSVLRPNKEGTMLPVTFNAPVKEDATLGFVPKNIDSKDFIEVNKMSPLVALGAGAKESYDWFAYNIKQFKLILNPKTEAYKQVKSPVGMIEIVPPVWDWGFVWQFMAFFSIALAVINLMPIPGLDGGHALFTLVEMLTGKTMNEKTAGIVQTAGMVFLLSVMALTFGKDIWKLVADNL